ncbi:RICIN domain-containing protein [Streptomyces sp. NBC_01198]|uniref:RICIN domain-containing protein n=1 Tax=Streptomyces sp. NBC_01198 TaxID=2903769 RepID=UPI002E12551F|nr:RICIN domain-containing protein [Streptomyces sp. NBC_01198]
MRTSARVTALLVSAAALFGTALSGADTASAASTIYLIKNDKLGMCATPKGGSGARNTQVTQWTCNGDPSQKWFAVLSSTGYELMNYESGMCLIPYGGSSSQGANLVLWDCNLTANEKWFGVGTQTLMNAVSGRIISTAGNSKSNGAYLTQQSDVNASPGQQWFAEH